MSDLPTAPLSPPPPEPPPRPPLPLGRLLLGTVLVLIGFGWLLDVTGAVELDWAIVWPVALMLVGVGLVVAAWEGRSRGGLVALGTLLTVLLTVGTVAEVPIAGGVGERVERPSSPAEIPRRYELAVGQLTVDLRELRWAEAAPPGSVRVRASLGLGDLVVLVGEGFPCVSTRARAGLGEVVVFGERAGGITPEYRSEAVCLAAPVLELDLSVGLGEVEVRRG